MIGAGAAGIAAARRIAAANRKVIVVEAASQVGGRCITDTSTFDVPFDRGARWIHNPETNPMIRLGRAAGLEIMPAPLGAEDPHRPPQCAAERDRGISGRAGQGQPRHRRGLARQGRRLLRLRDAEGARRLGRHGGVRARRQLCRQGSEGYLRVDKVRAQDRNSAIACRQGLGTLIAKLAEQLPLSLSTPASRIEWSNRDAVVQTPAGKITARAVIITVSSNVLAAGNIKFAPDIPKRTLDAAAKLGLGSYDHIALQMPGNPLGLARDDILIGAEQFDAHGAALRQYGLILAVLDRRRWLLRSRSLGAGRAGDGRVRD